MKIFAHVKNQLSKSTNTNFIVNLISFQTADLSDGVAATLPWELVNPWIETPIVAPV